MDEQPPINPSPQPTGLKDRVSKTGRVLWSGIGVLATMGGVFGLYQTLAKPDQSISGATAEEVIVSMVENKVIGAEEAGRIVSSLTSGSAESSLSIGTVQDVAANGTDRQREGLRLLSEKHTRDQGLEILEAEAKSSKDWLLLSKLYGTDKSEEALSSIKKSIALDPENFEALSLLANFQAQRGKFADAKRSALTADLLAEGPEEQLLSARGFLRIVNMARDLGAVEEKQFQLKSALKTYIDKMSDTEIPSSIGFGEYREQPAWVIAGTHTELSNSYLTRLQAQIKDDEDFKKDMLLETNAQAKKSIAALKPLLPAVHSDDRFSIVNAIAQAQSRMAYVHFSNDEFDKGVQISRRVLDLIRAEAETGDRRAIEALPQFYQNYSAYLINNGDKEEALKAMRRSTDLQITYAQKFETENLDIKVAGLELNYDVMMAASGDTSKIDDSLEAYMTMAEKSLRANPDIDGGSEEIFNGYLSNIASVSSFYVTDRFGVQSETKALAPVSRAAKFNQKMIKAHGKNHDRLHYDFYFDLLIGDLHYQLENKSKALTAYLKALQKAPAIPPKEDEENVVKLSQLLSYLRIASLELEPSNDAVVKGIDIARELDDAKQLQTQYQGYYYQLTKMAKERSIDINGSENSP